MKTLGDLGEDALIERIGRAAARSGAAGQAVRLGIGDDAALLRPRRGEDLALSSDALVEGVHFRWESESPRNAGRRALAAALSDLAAMGARPLGFLLSLAAPARLSLRRLDGLLAGLLHEARAHACPLVGGNFCAARQTSLTLSVLGATPRGRALSRRGARVGDRICVTGTLGAMALQVARGRVRRVPSPRLAAGRRLARMRSIGGCIDVSDGLELDLARLLGPGLDAELDATRVPVARGFAAACRRAGLDPERLALGGGEDYELLFTVRPSGPSAALLGARLGLRVSQIGRVVPRARGRRSRPRGFRQLG